MKIDETLFAFPAYREGFGSGSGILENKKNPYSRGSEQRKLWSKGAWEGLKLRNFVVS